MGTRTTMNIRGLQMRLRAMANASPAARRSAVRIMGETVIKRVLATSPADTNRYKRGWAEAGNAAGVGIFAVPQYNRSSRYSEMLSKLADAAADWRYILKTRYDDKGRNDRHRAKAQAQLEKAEKRLADFLSNESGAVVGFNLYGGGRQFSARHKIYGGRGRIVSIGDRTYVELHNLEPHATMVEKQRGVMRRAVGSLRGAGLKRAGKGYIDRQAAAFKAGR